MKNAFYKGSITLTFLTMSLHMQSTAITGISEPFVFGSPPIPLPLSFLAIAIPAGLILLVTTRRYFRLKRKAAL